MNVLIAIITNIKLPGDFYNRSVPVSMRCDLVLGLPTSSVIRTPNPDGPVKKESTSLEDLNVKLQPPPPPPPVNAKACK